MDSLDFLRLAPELLGLALGSYIPIVLVQQGFHNFGIEGRTELTRRSKLRCGRVCRSEHRNFTFSTRISQLPSWQRGIRRDRRKAEGEGDLVFYQVTAPASIFTGTPAFTPRSHHPTGQFSFVLTDPHNTAKVLSGTRRLTLHPNPPANRGTGLWGSGFTAAGRCRSVGMSCAASKASVDSSALPCLTFTLRN